MCKEEKIFIYALIDPITNAVRYIGKTNNLYERYYRHLQELQDPKKKNYHSKNWIRGIFSLGYAPKLEILETCNKTNWQEKEMYWIAFYTNLKANLTNMTIGGDGGGMLNKVSPKRLPVTVYDLKGNLLKKCESLTEAENFSKVHSGRISTICKRKRHSAKGFVFRYDNDTFEYNPAFNSSEIKNFQKLEIYEINLNGEILNKFQQANKVSELYHINRSNVVFVCNHPFKKKGLRKCKNRYFVYAKNYEDIVRSLEKSKT